MEGVTSSLALYRTRSIQHYYRRCAYFACQQPTELTPPPIKMDSSISLKDQIWFLRVCHHILISLYQKCFNYNALPFLRIWVCCRTLTPNGDKATGLKKKSMKSSQGRETLNFRWEEELITHLIPVHFMLQAYRPRTLSFLD